MHCTDKCNCCKAGKRKYIFPWRKAYPLSSGCKDSGELVEAKTYQPQPTINAELPTDEGSYDYTKVLWWRNLSALRPLCDAVKIEPIKIE